MGKHGAYRADHRLMPGQVPISFYEVTQRVRVHAFGTWYEGTVIKVGPKRVTVTYTSGTGYTRDKAVGPEKVRPLEVQPDEGRERQVLRRDGVLP